MKSIMNIAVCGILAFAFQANAASVQLLANSAQALQESAKAQEWAAQELGVKAGASIADLNAAIAKRSSVDERAAAINMINSFAKNVIVSNGDRSLKAKNENLAKLVFTTSNGQLLQVASMVQGASGRENITNAADGATCSRESIAHQLYTDVAPLHNPRVTEAMILKNLKYLSMGTCGRTLTGMENKLAELHELLITDDEGTCLGGADAVGNPATIGCIAKGHQQELGLDEVASLANAKAVRHCGYNVE